MAGDTTDWLTAIGGVGTLVATLILAGLASAQMRATRRQSDAALDQARYAREQAEVTREAAERQVYPRVYAHEWKGLIWDEDEEAFAVRYYLSNEGLGPALDVEHGCVIAGREYVFGYDGPFMFRSVQPGEFLPPLDPARRDPVPPQPIVRVVERADLYGSSDVGPATPVGEIVLLPIREPLRRPLGNPKLE